MLWVVRRIARSVTFPFDHICCSRGVHLPLIPVGRCFTSPAYRCYIERTFPLTPAPRLYPFETILLDEQSRCHYWRLRDTDNPYTVAWLSQSANEDGRDITDTSQRIQAWYDISSSHWSGHFSNILRSR